MSLRPGTVIWRSALDGAARALAQRWVQAILFAATFLAAWLHGIRVAHAIFA
jgi:hypothetical protein